MAEPTILHGLFEAIATFMLWLKESILGEVQLGMGVDPMMFFAGVSLLLFAFKFDTWMQYIKILFWIAGGALLLMSFGLI